MFMNKKAVYQEANLAKIIKPMSRVQDLLMLSMMCFYSVPHKIEGFFIKKHFSYYVPVGESDLKIAKTIFEKHDINMETCMYDIGDKGNTYPALRCNHKYNIYAKSFMYDLQDIREHWTYKKYEEDRKVVNNVLAQCRELVR